MDAIVRKETDEIRNILESEDIDINGYAWSISTHLYIWDKQVSFLYKENIKIIIMGGSFCFTLQLYQSTNLKQCIK